nr:zinc finger, CCHC-type [Tanacetum cinerariifolium]
MHVVIIATLKYQAFETLMWMWISLGNVSRTMRWQMDLACDMLRLQQIGGAKSYALSEGESSLQDHYGMLRSYAKAFADSNVGSSVKVGVTVNPDEQTYFDRFCVCLKGLKEGWKLGCRKVIVLDGCTTTKKAMEIGFAGSLFS